MSRIINFLAGLSSRIKAFKDVLLINIFSFVVFFILYLFYWQFGEAKDLLITLNQEDDLQIGLFFMSLLVLAAVCWWLPKYLYEENIDDFAEVKSFNDFLNTKFNKHTKIIPGVDANIHDRRHYNIMLPRVLGTGVLVLVSLSIWNIGYEQGTRIFKLVEGGLIFALLNVLVLILFLVGSGDKSAIGSHMLVTKKTEKNKLLLYGPFLLIIVLLAGLATINSEQTTTMFNLFLATALISMAFLRFTMVRSNLPFFRSDRNMVITIMILSALCIVLFFIINFCHPLNRWLNPLTCANLAFAFYLILFYTLRLVGAKRPRKQRFYLASFCIVLCMVLYSLSGEPRKAFYGIDTVDNYDPQDVRGAAPKPLYDDDERMDLETYFEGWLLSRSGHITDYLLEDSTSYFPVFVVSSEGGGSMSAYWVNLILGAIQEARPTFYHKHLFAMTGASGGTTGNSVFFLMNEAGIPPAKIQEAAREIFIQNYLSTGLTRLLGADFWSSLVFIGGLDLLDNRSEILERQWTKAIQAASGFDSPSYNDPLLSFWYEPETYAALPHRPPLVIFTNTFIQSSGPGHFSPVKLDSTWSRSIDLVKIIHDLNDDKRTVRMSSANVVNASFPYINNTTYIPEWGNFADAGYYDNFGGQMAANMGKTLQKYLDNNDTFEFADRIKLISLVVQNSRIEKPAPPSGSDVQAMGPLRAATGVMGAYYFYNRNLLSEVYDDVHWLALTKEQVVLDNSDTINVQVPISRYLSRVAMDAMKASADRKVQTDTSTLMKVVTSMKPSLNQ